MEIENHKNTSAVRMMQTSVGFNGCCVLDDFDLTLPRGSQLMLTGPSGCGKSTVLRLILGFVQPQKGTIEIFDRPVTADSVFNLRSKIAYVPQSVPLWEMTVEKFLQSPFDYKANSHLNYQPERVKQLMDMFNLPARLLAENFDSLSVGQRQRVTIISAIILCREIYLLDEVTSALDPENSRAVTEYFKNFTGSVLWAVHDPDSLGLDLPVKEVLS